MDKKVPIVYTENPYSYNYISLKKKEKQKKKATRR